MIKTGLLLFRPKETDNSFYYFIGNYVSIFGKVILLKKGILLLPATNKNEWLEIEHVSRIPYGLKNVNIEEHFDIIERLNLFDKLRGRIDEESLQLIWNKDLIKKYNIKFYTVLSKYSTKPFYVFGTKNEYILQGLFLSSSSYYKGHVKELILCEPVIFMEDALEIEKIISKYEFIKSLGDIVRETITEELDKLEEKLLEEA